MLKVILFVCLLATPVFAQQLDHNAQKVVEYPTSLQLRISYDGSGNAEYVGIAGKGAASSAAVWNIQKFTYSGSDVTLRQFAVGTWDDRASHTYS